MRIRLTALPGVVVVESVAFTDHRGTLCRLYCERELAPILGDRRIAQINHSRTRAAGVIRGLHFQHPPHAEMKLVRCLRGRVWDVAVDLRRDSSTFLHWHAETLSPENGQMLVVPEGCAHGFQALDPDSELLYLHTQCYEPQAEAGLRYDDARLGISWPLAATDVSERDLRHPPLAGDYRGIGSG